MTKNVTEKKLLKSIYILVNIRVRSLELESEQNARKAKQFEAEKDDFEKKLQEMVAKYNVVKQELDSTLKGLEDL
jgi:tropomyosin